jgi:lipoprotein-releasing system permease protein
MYEYDSKFVYVSLASAQEFFGMDKNITGIEYKLNDIEQTQPVARRIQEMVGSYPYYTKDWMQMNRNLFSALKLEKIAMFIILMALIFMASLLILVALIMVVIEKGKEIAILKSMGATDTSVMKIFVTYGLIIGGFGAGLGLILGVSLCGLIQIFGIGLDPEVYYITRIPVLIDPVEVLMVAIGAIAISFFATIPPSLFAARLKPVEGLRYE